MLLCCHSCQGVLFSLSGCCATTVLPFHDPLDSVSWWIVFVVVSWPSVVDSRVVLFLVGYSMSWG